MPVGFRRLHRFQDFLSQRVADPLVGIDFEDPLPPAGINPGIAALTLDPPVALDDAIREAFGDGFLVVCAFIQQDDDLIGEMQRLQAVAKLVRFIMHTDHR